MANSIPPAGPALPLMISFDPTLSDEQIVGALEAITAYFRSCYDAGLSVNRFPVRFKESQEEEENKDAIR